MSKRKHVSLRKRCAIFALALGDVPYLDAKKMTEDQILSLYQFDHNMLHESGHADSEKFWNFTPRLIKAHREKTKRDAAIIAKGRRIRQKDRAAAFLHWSKLMNSPARPVVELMGQAVMHGFEEGARSAYERIQRPPNLYAERYNAIDWSKKPKRKIRSRGFDKTKCRKMDGTVKEKTR